MITKDPLPSTRHFLLDAMARYFAAPRFKCACELDLSTLDWAFMATHHPSGFTVNGVYKQPDPKANSGALAKIFHGMRRIMDKELVRHGIDVARITPSNAVQALLNLTGLTLCVSRFGTDGEAADDSLWIVKPGDWAQDLDMKWLGEPLYEWQHCIASLLAART
jgi:hypothetical protein